MMDLATIGRYEIKSELGRGGMATVYRAYDPQFKRQVAVKVLPREFLHHPEFRARFEREAEVIAALEHSAIVPVYDFGEDDGQPYIVMQLMPGGSLAERLATGPLSLDETARILSRLAPALDHAHHKGIIHRDLKPGNILFDEGGHPYLSDFGIAKISQGSATFTGSGAVGTPAYMSPEQARGDKDIDGRSDVYALGAILFQALTGKPPYEADTPVGVIIKHITEPVPSILDSNPNLPVNCEELVRRAMAKEREKRFERASELAHSLTIIASPTERAVEGAQADTHQHQAAPAGDQAAHPTLGVKTASSTAPSPSGKKLLPARWMALGLIGLILALSFAGPRLIRSLASSPPLWSGDNLTATDLPETATFAPPSVTPMPQATQLAGLKQQATVTAAALLAQQTTTALAAVNATATRQALQAIGGGTGRLAFESSGLWMMNLDGSELFLFTITEETNPDDECYDNDLVSWSPDGTRVLLRALTARGYSLCVANSDGTEARLLVLLEEALSPPTVSWSPDSQKIIFDESASDGTGADLYIINSDGSRLTPLPGTSDLFAYEPNWSPDGQRIVFRGHAKTVTDGQYDARGIYTIGVDGSGLTRLTDGGYAPCWSPDGKKIIFMVRPPGGSPDLYVMNADGSEQTRLVSGQAQELGLVAWSPDNQRIAFTTWDGQSGQLFVMNSDGSNLQKLAEKVSGFDWSPNGQKIAFSSNSTEDNQQGIYLVNPNGTALTRISNEIVHDLAWQP